MKFPLYNPLKPPPAPLAFGIGKPLPEGSAPLLSKLVFQWLAPFLDVGFSRPLETEDFWELPKARLTSTICEEIEANFYARCPPEKRPRSPPEEQSGSPSTSMTTLEAPELKVTQDHAKENIVAEVDSRLESLGERKPNELEDAKPLQSSKPIYDESLPKAIHKTFLIQIWIAGILKLLSDTLKTMTPLLNKVILTWLAESYSYSRLSDAERAAAMAQGFKKPPGIGYGIGLAIALFVMQEAASLMTNHYIKASYTMGLSMRTGIIGTVFRKSLRLSGRARVNHSVGQITTMISTDAARVDRFCFFAHSLWVSPIQVAIGIGLLIGNLGVSALVGLGVLLLAFPFQFILVKMMFIQRKKGVLFTDKRVRLTTEVLQGIRLIKFYGWEAFYAHKIEGLRSREIRTIRKVVMARCVFIAIVTLIPILATILSFITYALSGHELNVAIIFSSLQLFTIIRLPLVFFPYVLSSLSDAMVALRRISKYLTAEDLPDAYPIDKTDPVAVQVDGDFVWENVMMPPNRKGGKFGRGSVIMPGGHPTKGSQSEREEPKESRWWKKGSGGKNDNTVSGVLPLTVNNLGGSGADEEKRKEEEPFRLDNLKLVVPKGSFVGIVGRVGSGKSSVLQALIGEMRRLRGQVKFGGTVSYVPQVPWIRNASLRDNVLFGQKDDEARFREIIDACSLGHDLEVLPQGEDTEIGEKGINLSGGQKARVSLARAAYSDSDIVLLDDPLSAVDAYVGKSILENCLLSGPLANRTRILATHALHVLDKMDYIYVMDNGMIIEEGTYEDLRSNSIIFSHLIDEYGNLEAEEETRKAGVGLGYRVTSTAGPTDGEVKKGNHPLMQTEERNTGAVTWSIYSKYLRFAGGVAWAPFILILLMLSQGAQVGNNLFLGFWTGEGIPGFKQGDYMAVYVLLGVAQAIFAFVLNFVFAWASLIASLNLFKAALNGVLRSPTSFFDTTPMGRILSRLSKDQDTVDTELSITLVQFLSTFSSVIGAIALIFYTFPLLGIIFVPLSVLYYLVSMYYRRSSVETKRIDSLLRSILYGSFTETLTGLATIRAYRQQGHSIRGADRGLDLENRAYYMTISIQQWLAVRLDFLGNILILGIAFFAAGFRHSVNPSKIGVVLSYTLSITQVFSDMISQFAQNEQNMNAVERVLHYSELSPEGEATTPNDPPHSWPERGEITFTNVEFAYRKGLPLVLKGISFKVHPGEKIGIVGRTGAGKSSLVQGLFRIVELQSGTIEIDGTDIHNVGLDTLRGRLALVPQDSTLFLGTLRENLDPIGLRTDAELISVLQRTWLLPRKGQPPDPAAEAKFSLDAVVGDEGANFSAGEKQLLALSRALVKNSRIIILDEATSSVDVEMDAKLQKTIQTEFASSTLLCIAHRLNTIAYYDRVLVMDGGKVAEFDKVLNLYDKTDSIFRSLCDEANLQREDILRIRAEHDSTIHA